MPNAFRRTFVAALLAATAGTAQADIVRFEIEETVPAFGGEQFGEVGAYELVRGRAFGEVDPADPRNARIADIDLAPKNAAGRVEYSTEVQILRPADPAKGNGRLFFEVLNRGNKLALGDYNDGPGGNDVTKAEESGNGFLMRRGYAVAWAGWQSGKNVAASNARMKAEIPEATAADGTPLTADVIMSSIFNNTDGTKIGLLFAPAEANENAFVQVRNSSTAAPTKLPRDAWDFDGDAAVAIQRDHPALKEFDAGAQYDVVYTAKNPDVSGIGYAITRDVAAFLRHDSTDANPLNGRVQYALAQGTSQSGRMLKGFVADGFNEDETGGKVFDGINVNISGAHGMALNERFGDANATGRAYERHANAKLEFPFTYGQQTDPLTGAAGGILAICTASNTCPKIMHTDGGNEAWGKAASLVVTDGKGVDIALPDDVRVYYFASTQHGPATKSEKSWCQQLTNPARWQPIQRALLVGLDEWVSMGILPPDSAYPRMASESLRPAKEVGFPAIPGVTFNGTSNQIGVPDKSVLPNAYVPGKDYTVWLPRTDVDGNDLAGIRPVEVAVPLGTYTGWALRREGFAKNEECQLNGQFIPFAATRAERDASGDPRLSLEERYPRDGAYVRMVALVAQQMVDGRTMLPEDADAAVAAAAARPE